MQFYEQKYNSKIKFFYSSEFEEEFCEEIINFFWLNKDSIKENVELVKSCDHRKVKVFKLDYNSQVYYLKKYSYKRISKKIENNIFRRPEGVRNIKIGTKLLESNIITAKPIFSAVKRNLICFDSLFLTTAAEGLELEEYAKEKDLSGNQEVLIALGKLWAKFIDNRFIHQDPGLDNFFILANKKGIKLTVIDIDSVYLLPFLPKRVALNTLARFIVKTYLGLFKHDKKLLKTEDINLFLRVFVKECNVNFELKNITPQIDRLIIKKLVHRNKEEVILASSTLSSIL